LAAPPNFFFVYIAYVVLFGSLFHQQNYMLAKVSHIYQYLSIFIPGTLYVQAFSRAALEEWLPSVKEIMRSKAAHEARKQGGFVALNHLESST